MITLLVSKLSRLPLDYPRAVLAVALILTILSGIIAPQLEISTDRNLLAGKNDPSAQRRDEVNRLFGTTLVAAVVIQGEGDPEELRAAADKLSRALSTRKDLVRDVFVKADIGFFERHALMFVPEEGLKKLTQSISRDDLGLGTLENAGTLPELVSMWADRAESATLPEDATPESVTESLTAFGDVLDDVTAWLGSCESEPLDLTKRLWKDSPAMNGSTDTNGYLMDNDGRTPRLAVLFVQPVSNSQAMEAVAPFTDFIRQQSTSVLKEHSNFKSYVTGMPALTTDEMRVVARDVVVTGTLSALSILLVFALLLRSFRVTLFAGVSLGIGILWTTGLTAVIYGHLTLVSGYFAAQLLGLGVGYTIYIISRFHEALVDGESREDAVKTAITKAGPGVVGSALTSAVAFGAVVLSDFRGFSELGVIAGCGTILVLLANLLVLPAILLLFHPGIKSVKHSSQSGPLFAKLARTPLPVAIIGLLAFAVGIAQVGRVGFDYAVENLLPGESDSVIGLRLLNDRTDFSANYSVSITDSIDKAEVLRKKFEKLSTVSRAEALSMFVPENQDAKKAVIATISDSDRETIIRTAAAIQKSAATAGKSTAAQFAESLQKLHDVLEDLSFDAGRAGRAEAAPLKALVKKVEAAQKAAASQRDDSRVQALERQIFGLLNRGLGVLVSGLSDKGFGPSDLPAAVRGRYLSQNNKVYAVIVFPKGDIGDKAFFEKHVGEILSVDKGATGHPVTHLAFTHLIHRGFLQAAILATIAVIFVVLLDLRRPRDFLLAILPVVIGAGWVTGIMALTDLKFNYANLMAIPILIGTGVDFGINLAHRARQEGSIRTAVRTTGKAIAISGSATIFGFGSLILGQHWGVKSLGLCLVLGIFTCLVLALVIVPVLFERRSSDSLPSDLQNPSLSK